MSSTIEHSADEAGGEAVFTSDGLPSLSAPLPPPVPPLTSSVGSDASGNNDAIIEGDSGVDPRATFEQFYVSRGEGAGWSALSNSTGATPWANDSGTGGVSMEDPRRRLFRLKAEINELEGILAKEAKNEEAGNEEDLQSLAKELKSRLDGLGVGGDSASLATMLRGRRDDLSHIISREVKKCSEVALEKDSGFKGKGESGKIIYELYRSPGDISKSAFVSCSRGANLEERLRRLEIVMGTNRDDKSDGSKTLLERLDDAERLAQEIELKEVEKVAAKAKVIRSDLEAAARAKSKLSTNSSNSVSISAKDSKTIIALHNQLVQLEGISACLPALTLRLTELSNLHSNAAEFGARLDAAEVAVSRSEVLLDNVEEALEKMEAGWIENMKAVEKNAKNLDDIVSRNSSS